MDLWSIQVQDTDQEKRQTGNNHGVEKKGTEDPISGSRVQSERGEQKHTRWSFSGGAAEVSCGGGGAMPRSTKLPAFSLHLSQPIPALRSLSLSPGLEPALLRSGVVPRRKAACLGSAHSWRRRQHTGPTDDTGGRNRLLVTSSL
jgi:hypothetical protein